MDKEKFFKKVNKQSLMYLDEVVDMLREFGMDLYVSHFKENGMYRWYPEEVIKFVALVDESRSNSYPWANACEKYIPDFLLKDA